PLRVERLPREVADVLRHDDLRSIADRRSQDVAVVVVGELQRLGELLVPRDDAVPDRALISSPVRRRLVAPLETFAMSEAASRAPCRVTAPPCHARTYASTAVLHQTSPTTPGSPWEASRRARLSRSG